MRKDEEAVRCCDDLRRHPARRVRVELSDVSADGLED
jgi:hypothetical protein